jgi:hypothetical protein
MTTTNSPTRPRSEIYPFVNRALIVVQGAITLFACFFVFPLGAALVIANGAMAIATRGLNRKLFTAFAIAGAVICILMALFLPAVSYSVHVGPATKL